MAFKTQYYKYNNKTAPNAFGYPIDSVWGNPCLYKLSAIPQSQRLKFNPPRPETKYKYNMMVFNRNTRQWINVGLVPIIPQQFKLLTKKELFLELL